MEDLKRLLSVARDVLVVRAPGTLRDRWLLEHSERVMDLALLIAAHPEAGAEDADRVAMCAAGLFHDAGWVVQCHAGEISHWQILARPTNEAQRELAAGFLLDVVGDVLEPDRAQRAAEIIRECNSPNPDSIEARIVAEAESLDEIGIMCVLRQFRQFQAEGRSLEHLRTSWVRQNEYGYWDARLQSGLRFPFSRRIARERLDAVAVLMDSLEQQRTSADVRTACEAASDA